MAAKALRGELRLPGDKSISHRALILSAMAEGQSTIENLSGASDVRSTWRCLRELGIDISSRGGRVSVRGRGWRGLSEPRAALDAGNSGTTLRLLMGLIAGNPIRADLTGDESLRRRPMARVAEPLRRMGATIDLAGADFAPATVRGASLEGIDFISPVASAQVKSAVLLAGLLARGSTSVTEPALSRDHTERLLPCFGVEPRRQGLRVSVEGGLRLAKTRLTVPGDLSSAAFWVVAASMVPGSELRLSGVGLNPTRAGFLDALDRMGASIERAPAPRAGPEPWGDLVVRSAPLRAVVVEPGEVPRLIDEVPILALAASQAQGVSRFQGLSELRRKESDRLSRMAELLTRLGGEASVEGEDLVVAGPRRLRGAKVSAGGDHRLAMTALVAGLVAQGEVSLADPECVRISYPSFLDDLERFR